MTPQQSPDHADARQRVLVTGLGAVTPYGVGAETLWRAVVSGRSAVRELAGDQFAELPVRIGGQITAFDPAGLVATALARRLSPVQLWAIAAADEALRHAGALAPGSGGTGNSSDGPPPLPWPAERIAVIAATGSGPVDAMQSATRALVTAGPRRVPFTLSVYGSPESATGVLCERYGIRGASQAVSATCASGTVGLGQGLRMIRHGYADAVLVIGMEDCLNPVNLASNARMGALAAGYEHDPAAASRPFDAGRSGFVMSAGAGAVLLESEDAWARRAGTTNAAEGVIPGPTALAELAGFGASSDAHHPTAPPPDGHGGAQAVAGCLAEAGMTPTDLDHINAHGTGTELGDAAELVGLAGALGDTAYTIPISATKSATGHMLGASGVIEAIIAIRSMETGTLPPTINLDDSAFPDWDIVAHSARAHPVRTVLSTSFGFGGHNGAIILRAPVVERHAP